MSALRSTAGRGTAEEDADNLFAISFNSVVMNGRTPSPVY